MCKLDILLHLKENHRHHSCWEVAFGLGLPRSCSGKEPTCSCRRCRRLSFGGEICQGLFKMFWTHGRNIEKDVEMFFFLSFLRSIIMFSREWKVISSLSRGRRRGSHVVQTLCYFAFSVYLHCCQMDGRGLHAEFNTERRLDFASSLPFRSVKYEIGTQMLVNKALKTVRA